MDYENQRSEPRKKVSIPAVVSDRDRTFQLSAHICDASSSGCRITECPVEQLPDEILIKIESVDKPIKGSIAWRAPRSAGVKFIFDRKTKSATAKRGGGKSSAARRKPEPAEPPDPGFAAIVRDGAGTQSFKCLVKFPSGVGCLIVADDVAALPDVITVKFGDLRQPLRGRIVWRSAAMAGVAFEVTDTGSRFFV
jgi:PilZ domain